MESGESLDLISRSRGFQASAKFQDVDLDCPLFESNAKIDDSNAKIDDSRAAESHCKVQ